MTIQQVEDAYYLLVKNGRRELGQVPSEHRTSVEARLEQDNTEQEG